MGCFTVLKSKKKKSDQLNIKNRISLLENAATVLPESLIKNRRIHSAPPSFNARTKTTQPAKHVTFGSIRALSAPSSLHEAEPDLLSAVEYDRQDHDSRIFSVLTNDERAPSPQPLPLPSPQNNKKLRCIGSFKSKNTSNLDYASSPLPLPPLRGIKSFSYEEIESACQNFSLDRFMPGLSSMSYEASFGNDTSGMKKLEATVTCFLPANQGFKEFISEINILSTLQHPRLCKLLGFCARGGSEQRMLVYERLFHGSLNHLLYGRTDGPPIDWCSRMKVAFCAAQGLAFLHEEGPFQAIYQELSTSNIQIDKDFSAKLSGYGCVCHNPDAGLIAGANISVETAERGLLTPKSNVWSFGIVLLELLTGRKNLDVQLPQEEKHLVKWSRPFLVDDCRLSLIMDPRLKGRFPPRAARAVADIALKCLLKDPSERPTMRTIADSLKLIQDLKYPCRFPLQEPSTIADREMLRSPSLNGNNVTSTENILPSLPLKSSPLRPPLHALLPPPCSSLVSLVDQPQDGQKIALTTT